MMKLRADCFFLRFTVRWYDATSKTHMVLIQNKLGTQDVTYAHGWQLPPHMTGLAVTGGEYLYFLLTLLVLYYEALAAYSASISAHVVSASHSFPMGVQEAALSRVQNFQGVLLVAIRLVHIIGAGLPKRSSKVFQDHGAYGVAHYCVWRNGFFLRSREVRYQYDAREMLENLSGSLRM